MELDEVFSSFGFWALGGGAAIATVMGFILSKKWEIAAMPLWQLIVIIAVEFVAAAFFVMKE